MKVDGFPLQSNVHFPSDYNLALDAVRKCLSIVEKIIRGSNIKGWRKHQDWLRKTRNSCRHLGKVSAGGGKNKSTRLAGAAVDYLSICRDVSNKLKESASDLSATSSASPVRTALLLDLDYYEKMLDKHIDLIFRRLIKGEDIPHAEKVFSIFEPYTEWIKKGKSGNRVDLGLNVVIATDQYDYIVAHRILEQEHEVESARPLIKHIKQRYNLQIASVSFDKGFWSPENRQALEPLVELLVLPKKGKRNAAENKHEHTEEFIQYRHKHAAVESNINCLNHHSLDRCPDHGIGHFRSYVSLGILGYNLHKLGNDLLVRDVRKSKRRQRAAA